jgi:hypothetical protein
MTRLTLNDMRSSLLPGALGLCVDDIPSIAAYINEAQERLIMLAGETGWWGGWARVAFSVDPADPYITLPSQFVRAINLDVCQFPIRINNEFYEFLAMGPGLTPNGLERDWCGKMEGFEKGAFPTLVDLTATNQKLVFYLTDNRDANLFINIVGLDANGNRIYSTDTNGVEMNGFQLALTAPFIASAFVVSKIDGIQKGVTYGDIVLKQQDQTTFAEVTLSRIEARETSPSYRRYYISRMPGQCCTDPTTGRALVTALCKLDYVPVLRDSDFLLVQNRPALIEECQAIRYSRMDVTNAAQLEAKHHAAALRLLRGQQRHTMGEQRIAVTVDAFEGASLEDHSIGTIT